MELIKETQLKGEFKGYDGNNIFTFINGEKWQQAKYKYKYKYKYRPNVKLWKDGRIGLFDTKGGYTAELAGSRAEGLARYIAEQNKEGKKLFGGIFLKEKNSWRLHNKATYSYNPNDLKEWEYLNLVGIKI